MELNLHKIMHLAGMDISPDELIHIPDIRIKYLLTDSRDLTFPQETAFFAIRTPSADGHDYISDLAMKGVKVFFTDRPDYDAHQADTSIIIHVDNVMVALQNIAAGIRQIYDEIPLVAITGSRGKTVVKEHLYNLLRTGMNVVRSPRSYNSQIGVPLSLWELKPDTQLGIFEAGISRKGEMQKLEKILHPNIGVFTQLTDAHAEGFSSLQEKAEEKALLFTGCTDIYCPRSETLAIETISRMCPDAILHIVDGGNQELALAVGRHFIPSLKMQMPLHVASTRIMVSETLKNCLIVFDNFTCDSRSVSDAIVFQQKRLTPGLKSTVILGAVDDAAPERMMYLADVMRAKNVSRLILVMEHPEQVAQYFHGIDVASVESTSEFIERYSISDFDSELILVKGPAEQGFENIKAHLEAPRHETVLEVNLNAVTHNFNYYKSLLRPSTGIIAMVKAAGYGIGSVELAKTLQSQGAAYLAVAVIDEGAELRRVGITMPIIVMNPISTNYKALFDNHLEPSVFSIRELNLLLDNASRLGVTDYPVHIKLDTGMHRLGFLEQELPELLQILSSQNYVRVRSVFSHLATADCLDQDQYTTMQLQAYESMSRFIKDALPYPILRHVLNTAGIMRYPEYQYDLVRLGIGLYGISPIPERDHLRTVARLTAGIISIKHWDKGTSIGYGRRGRVESPAEIATVGIGYADGLDRHLSCGHGIVSVNGKRCPIIGNICMDQCMIDVTGADARIGDTVEFFGDAISVEDIAETLGTIPYEILTSVSPRVKRIYYRE